METVFSGIQPSGELHLGNYLGAVRTWVDAAGVVPLLLLHRRLPRDHAAVRAGRDAGARARRWRSTSSPAASIPDSATLFVQSAVPEHTELAWVLSSVTPHGELERMTQFKDKSEHQPAQHQRRPLHLSGAAGGRHPALRRDARAGRRGSAPAPGAGARDRPPLQRPLRRHLRRAAAAVLDDAEDPGARRAGQDVEEPRQHDRARRARRRRSGTSCARPPPIRRASSAPIRGRPRSATSSRCTSSSRTTQRQAAVHVGLHHRRHRLHRLQEDAVRRGEGRARADPRARRRAAGRSGARRRDPGARRRRARARSPPRRWRACASGSGLHAARRMKRAAALALAGAARWRLAARRLRRRATTAPARRRRCGRSSPPRAPAIAPPSTTASARARARTSRRCWSPTHRTGGTRMLRPQDLVTVGWLPPAWEPAGTRVAPPRRRRGRGRGLLGDRRPPDGPHRPRGEELEGRATAPLSESRGLDWRSGWPTRSPAGLRADLRLIALGQIGVAELDDRVVQVERRPA